MVRMSLETVTKEETVMIDSHGVMFCAKTVTHAHNCKMINHH